MNKTPFNQILETYSPVVLLKAFATALIFYLLIGGATIVPIVVVSFLYVPFIKYFFLVIYVILAFTANYANNVFIETLTTYQEPVGIDTEKFVIRSTVVMAIMTFVLLAVLYVLYFK